MMLYYNIFILKKNQLFLFIVVCLIATACSHSIEKESREQLNQVEQLMEANPQKALQTLLGIQAGLLNEADYTYYNLLKIRLWDITNKNISTMDSIVIAAQNYFIEKKDAPKIVFASFVAARVYEKQGNSIKALYNYTIADNWAEKISYNTQNFSYFRIPYNMAVLYFHDKKYKESIEYINKAMRFIHNNENKELYVLYALELKGVNYHYLKDIDKALVCYDEALAIAQQNNDVTSVNRILSNKNALLYNSNQYNLAKQQARQLLSTISPNDTLNLKKTYLTLGLIYTKSNQLDSAMFYTQKAEKLSLGNHPDMYIVQIPLYKLLADIETKRGNATKAEYYKQQHALLEEQQQNLHKAQQAMLEAEQAQQKQLLQQSVKATDVSRQSYLKQKNQKSLISLLALVILGVAIFLSGIYIKGRHERRWIALIRQFGKQELLKSQLQREDVQRLSDWADRFIRKGIEPSLNDFQHLMQMLDDITPTSHWNVIFPYLKLNYGNMFKTLRNNFPMLNDKEFKVCNLIMAQVFTPKEIARIMRISIHEFEEMEDAIEHKMALAGYRFEDVQKYIQKLNKIPPKKLKTA